MHKMEIKGVNHMKPSINSKLSLVGVAIDLGAGTPGVSLGPAAIRYAGIVERLENIGYDVVDQGDIVAIKPAKIGRAHV